ncbi:hypothetical protein Dvina_06160 [Dactylosporangium vinaceum]|nr:hypothetical protein [Dactylosporangium vinaceum]UAB97704.1 hypothetical protein Dvina_06160 [Dactylosporangium vinaceum]
MGNFVNATEPVRRIRGKFTGWPAEVPVGDTRPGQDNSMFAGRTDNSLKSLRTHGRPLCLAAVSATLITLLLTGAPVRAEGGDDGGMPIQVVVSANPEATTNPPNGGGGGGGNGGLAVTGLDVVLIAGVGVGLVAAGAAVLIATRRRNARAAART